MLDGFWLVGTVMKLCAGKLQYKWTIVWIIEEIVDVKEAELAYL